MTRIFVPATMDLLARWHAAGVVDVDRAFAVTPLLRELYASGDTEELEYAALTHASRSSLMMLAADQSSPRRRVVLALDAAGAQPDAGLGASIVRLAAPPGFDSVSAVHVDGADAESAVVSAVSVLLAREEAKRTGAKAETGHEAIGELDDHELLWYATQEIPDLLLATS